MTLAQRKIAIVPTINDTPSINGQAHHPNSSLLCKNYNDLIDNELTNLNNTVVTNTGTITTLSGNVATHSTQISVLDSHIVAVEGDLGLLDTKVTVLDTKVTALESGGGGGDTKESIIVPLSGYTDLATVDAVERPLLGRYFPFNGKIDDIILTVKQAPVGNYLLLDILNNGVSIFKTTNRLRIDVSELTSKTASIPYQFVAVGSELIDEGDIISFKILQVGSTQSGEYPVVVLNMTRL